MHRRRCRRPGALAPEGGALVIRRPPLHLVASNPGREPDPDPMIAAIQHYAHGMDGIDHPDLSDDQVSDMFAKALAPLHQAPVARTAVGAAMALRMALGFEGLDPTDRILVGGALAYLESRCL